MEKIIKNLKNKYKKADTDFLKKLINIRLECSGNYKGLFNENFYVNHSVEYCMLLEDIEHLVKNGELKENFDYFKKLLQNLRTKKRYNNNFFDYIISDFLESKISIDKVVETLKKNKIEVCEAVNMLELYISEAV